VRDARTTVLLLAVLLAGIAGALLRDRPTAAGGTVQAPLAEVDGAAFRADAATARRAGVPVLPASGPPVFDPAVSPAHRAMVERALAAARPDARRVIDAVAPLATIRVGGAGPEAAGVTADAGDHFDVLLDLDGVQATSGAPGVARLVLHELAHVVDRAVVTTDVARRLDAAIPRGFGCERGLGGACAAPEERFAESFAKWATGDIGTTVLLGYSVPPPVPLATWGRPLVPLVARG
jgi:hypothetical protein